MNKSVETYQAVEKVFCAYIKIVLTRSAKGYFRAQYKYFNRSIPLQEVQEISLCTEADLNINIPVSNTDKLDECIENEILSAIVGTLNSKDKQLLYLKYFGDKTDYQLSLIFGVTQQSITERKNRVLKKLKSRLQI
ncbi:MAG: sigma-70 family RNA polymerase sigma factor [Bacillota bacterium]